MRARLAGPRWPIGAATGCSGCPARSIAAALTVRFRLVSLEIPDPWCDWDGRTFTHHCTVAVMVLDTPDPGFWQVKESAAATLTSDAGTATVTWLEST
jgi:hypothetical protein